MSKKIYYFRDGLTAQSPTEPLSWPEGYLVYSPIISGPPGRMTIRWISGAERTWRCPSGCGSVEDGLKYHRAVVLDTCSEKPVRTHSPARVGWEQCFTGTWLVSPTPGWMIMQGFISRLIPRQNKPRCLKMYPNDWS